MKKLGVFIVCGSLLASSAWAKTLDLDVDAFYNGDRGQLLGFEKACNEKIAKIALDAEAIQAQLGLEGPAALSVVGGVQKREHSNINTGVHYLYYLCEVTLGTNLSNVAFVETKTERRKGDDRQVQCQRDMEDYAAQNSGVVFQKIVGGKKFLGKSYCQAYNVAVEVR